MKNLYLLLLSVGLPIVFLAKAQELVDAQTWEELKKTSSTSITTAADNCQKSIVEARNNCKASIDRATQFVSQTKDSASVQALIKETVEEVSGILQSVSTNLHDQLLDIANRFQKRLQQVINVNNSVQPAIIQELKQILQSAIDESDKIVTTSRQLFSPSYDPSAKLKEAVGNEIGKITAALELELDQLQKIVIEMLNRFNRGATVTKDVEASLKNSGQLPPNWTSQNLQKILLSCAQTTLTLQSIEKMPVQRNSQTENLPKNGEIPREQKSKAATTAWQPVNNKISLAREEAELWEEENESDGCGKIVDRAKKKIRAKLVATVKEVKKATDAKTLDWCTSAALENYSELLDNVSYKIDAKIVEFAHQFIKLYTTVLGIMEKINKDMNDKMFEIFNDKSMDTTDFYYNNIRKYFGETYFTESKMNELYTIALASIKTAKTRKELQKQIIKQLSAVTSDLVRDMDTMKSTTLYILLEIRKGVIALQNLKNKSNVTGIRYWFNFYDGKAEIAQIKKLIYIINAIDISGLFERKVAKIQSSNSLSKCETITQMTQETLSNKTAFILKELDQKTNIQEVESVCSKFLQTFNSVITVYKLKLKKVIKQMVINFISVYEESLIMLKRKNIKEVEIFDTIIDNETRNIDGEVPLFGIYMAKNSKTDIEQGTGVSLRHKFKSIREAKYTTKNNINSINQILNSHITEMKIEIQNIMTAIMEEAKQLQGLQRDIENENYIITSNRFVKLEYLIRLANTLGISHGDIINDVNTNLNSSNQNLESYFDSAIERLRSEKQNGLLEIEKCTNIKQLQAQITTVTTHIKDIISDTVMETRTDINQYTTQYNTALDTYIKCTNHETLLKVLKRGRGNGDISISISTHLQLYLQDKYSNTALETLLTSACIENIQESKKRAVEALSLSIKEIESDIGSAKSEAMSTIFNTLKQSIDILEIVNLSETKQRLDNEKIQTLTLANHLLNILHNNIAIDTENSIEETRDAINIARESFRNEYEKSVQILTPLIDKSVILNELRNTVDLFESIYNKMQQSIKVKMETVSIEFYENFKMINAWTTNTKTILHEIMSGIYNNEFTQQKEYQKFLALVYSESYLSSLAISSIYEKMKCDQNMDNGQSLYILANLNREIIRNIDNIEEIVNFISHTYEESSNIIISINDGRQLDITNINDISMLTKSLLIYETLLQIQNRADFASVHKIINQEYQQAILTIESTNNENVIKDTMLQSIEKYNTVSNMIENEVAQKFMKIASDFTNKYDIVMQVVIAEGNEELLTILQNTIEQKTSNIVSEKFKKFKYYINSSSFKSTIFAKDSYQSLLQEQGDSSTLIVKNISRDQLKLLTSEVEEYIQELDIESKFASEQFLKGARILQSIQTGNFKLIEEQIQIITDCVTITQMIFKQNINNIYSKSNEEDWEAFSTAKKSIDEEYNYAIEIIKTTKERVIVEQTISTSTYKYDDIYNNLREEMKQTFSTLQIDFTTTYDTITEILQLQNIPIYNKLQKIQNKPSNISIKYIKFEGFIKSESFTSYSLIRNKMLKLKQNIKSTINGNKTDLYIEELTALTKIIRRQLEEINSIQKYITAVLYKSIEILQSTETDINVQLNEEQFTTLCEAFRISKTIEAVISSQEQIEEKFLIAERNINNIYESSISEMQTVADNNNSQQIISNNLQNYITIYNNLREEVKEIFTHKSTFFMSTFNTVSKYTLLQNTKLSSTFENIKNIKINIQESSYTYQEFINYIESDKFASSLYITNIYQNLKIQEALSTTKNSQRNIEQLTTLTNKVKQRIIEMNKIQQLILRYFNENIEYLKEVEKSRTSQFTQEQIIKLSECVNISETITFTCTAVLSEKEVIFEVAESTISEEYEKTISLIIDAQQESEIIQIINNSIKNYEGTYNILREKIKETLIQTLAEYSSNYTKSLEKLTIEEKTELINTLQTIKRMTTFIDNYRKCEVYLNSKSFKSSSWLSQYYLKNIQEKSTNKIKKENCIQELKVINSEINYQIIQARYTSKYIIQLFEQSTKILKLIENGNQQLSQEQTYILTESTVVLEQISCKFSEKSLQEESLYTTTQSNIQDLYQNAVITIQKSKDEKKVKDSLLKTVQSYDTTYNTYRNEVKEIFIKTTTEFSKHFDTTINYIMKENSNSVLQSTLQNIKRSKGINIQTSQEYTKFQLYISTEKFISINILKRFYNKLETQQQATTEVNEQGLYQLRSLTNEVDVLVNELNDMRQFISETIQKSYNILKTLETNTSTELTQEQIINLTESILIMEIISIQCNSISQKEERIFTTAETNIEQEWNNAINTIKSTNDMNIIEEIVTTTVKNYDKIYNEARESIKQVFTTTATEFIKAYTTLIETTSIQKKTKIQDILQNIQLKKVHNIEPSEKCRYLESYIDSNAFTTSLLATHSYQTIKQQYISYNISSVGNIRNIECVTIDIQNQLNEMSVMQKYVSQVFQRSTNILKNIKCDTNITELTQEEITILFETISISEIVNIEFNSKINQKEEVFIKAEVNIDQQYENALKTIRSTTDEKAIKQTVLKSVKTYDTTLKSIKEEVKNNFVETTTEFTNNFNAILNAASIQKNEALKTILKDIQEHKVEVQVSDEYKTFDRYISSRAFSSSFPIFQSYNKIQKEEMITNTETTINDKGIYQLEKLTTEVNIYISQTNIVRKYVTRIFQKSVTILKIINQEENIKLTTEQTTILNESIMISEKLSSSFNTVHGNVESISQAEIKVNEEYKNTLQTIKSITNEKEAQQVLSTTTNHYDSIYSNVCNQVQSNMQHVQENYTNKMNSILETLDEKSQTREMLQKILHNETKTVIDIDQDFQIFKSYINTNILKSSDSIQKQYKNLISSETNSQSNISERSIEQLTKLTENLSEKLTIIKFVENYTIKNYKKSADILDKVAKDKITELTKEEIHILTITREIMQIINLEVTVQETNDLAIQDTITQEYESAVKLIQTVETKEEVTKIISKNIQNYNKIYNNVQENIKTKLNQLSTEFTKNYNTTLQITENSSNIIQKMEDYRENIRNDEMIKLFKSYLENKNLSSKEAVDKSCLNNSKTTNESQSIKESAVKELQNFNADISYKLKEINNFEKYATENIAKGQEVIEAIQKNKDINLNEEQISILTKSIEIVETINKNIAIQKENNSIKKEVENQNTCNQVIEKEEEIKTDELNNRQKTVKEENINNFQRSVKEKSKATIDNIKSTENVREVQEEHIQTLDKSYSNALETKKTEITQTSTDFINHYQTTMNEVKNTNAGNILNEVMNENTNYMTDNDEELEKHISCIKSKILSLDSIKANTSISNTTEESENIINIKEESNNKINSINKEVNANLQEMEATSKFISENLQNSDNILKKIEKEKEAQLSEDEVRQIARAVKITKTLQESKTVNNIDETSTLTNEKGQELKDQKSSNALDIGVDNTATNLEEKEVDCKSSKEGDNCLNNKILNIVNQFSSTSKVVQELKDHESSKIAKKEEFIQSVPIEERVLKNYQSSIEIGKEGSTDKELRIGEQAMIVDKNQKIDFTAVQNTVGEENNNTIDSIKSTQDEELVKEIVEEHIHTLDNMYENIRQNTGNKISQTSSNFVNTFQSTLSHTQDTEVSNTLNEIMNENVKHLIEDEELQKFESDIKSKTFSSTSIVTNTYQSIEESENTTNVKEKSLHEIEAVGAKMNESLHIMEETEKFVSENLQKSTDILKKVEMNKEAKLNEEEIHQIAKCMKIAKVVYESETINIESTNTVRSNESAAQNKHIHKEIKEEMNLCDTQSTCITSQVDNNSKDVSKSTVQNLVKETNERETQNTFTASTKDDNIADIKDSCLSIQPQISQEKKSRVLEKISTNNLLINWKVVESKDKRWPSECRNLSWNSERFSDPLDNKVFVEEIGQVLKISRNLIENTIHMELKKLKLNRRIHEDLSAMTICVDNIYIILQRLSTYVFEEMQRFSSTLEKEIKTSNVQSKLKTVSATLDDEFMAVSRAFFELQYSKNSDILDIVDQQYKNEICNTIVKSKKVTKEKLEKLLSLMNTILDNIDCLILTMLNIFVNGKFTIENLSARGEKIISLESLKDSQKLYDILHS